MVLARAWRRRLLGAVGAATLAPGLLIVALAALAVGGGFASLGSLGQAISGPPAPAAQTFSPALRHGLAVSLPAPPPIAPGGGQASAGSGAVAGPGGAGTLGAQGGGTTGGGSGGGGSSGGGSGGGSSGGSGGGGSSGGQGSGTPSAGGSPANPTVVDQIAGAGSSLAGQVPGPAGPAVSQQLGSAAGTVDQVLPGGGRVDSAAAARP